MRMGAAIVCAAVIAITGCGGGGGPATEDEAVEQLELEVFDVGAGNKNFGLPDSECVAEELFFGEETAEQYEGYEGVLIADSGDWGVQLSSESSTDECVDTWQEAIDE